MRQMLALWLPLAASIVIMVLEPSIINIGLGRTRDQELALAAFGVAYGVALLVEAPILMLIDASVALSDNWGAFALVRRFTVLVGLAVTAIGLILSLTPAYHLVVEGWMRIPADVAAWARPTLALLAFWPFPIAWRRTYQGLLIRAGRTAVITAATVVRLIVLAAGLFRGLALWPENGPVLAGVGMDLSVLIEAGLVTWAAWPILRSAEFASQLSQGTSPRLTLGALWRFYSPLLATSVLRQTARPVLNAGIALASMPRASLATWPVAWGLAILIAGPSWSLQQLATALATDDDAYQRVWRFSMGLSLGFTLLLGLVAFTPLYGRVMGQVYNLSPELQALARPATKALLLLPLLTGAQSVIRGTLIRLGRTVAVRTATLVNVAFLVGTMLAGARLMPLTGVLLAALASLAGNVAELAWLGWEGRQSRVAARQKGSWKR